MKNNVQKQLRSIQKETDNPAIIQDVLNMDLGALPGNVGEVHANTLSNVEEYVVKNSVDGKTWNEIH